MNPRSSRRYSRRSPAGGCPVTNPLKTLPRVNVEVLSETVGARMAYKTAGAVEQGMWRPTNSFKVPWTALRRCIRAARLSRPDQVDQPCPRSDRSPTRQTFHRCARHLPGRGRVRRGFVPIPLLGDRQVPLLGDSQAGERPFPQRRIRRDARAIPVPHDGSVPGSPTSGPGLPRRCAGRRRCWPRPTRAASSSDSESATRPKRRPPASPSAVHRQPCAATSSRSTHPQWRRTRRRLSPTRRGQRTRHGEPGR